jgi:hypothetical protein
MMPELARTPKPCPVKACTRLATEGHHVLYERHDGGPVVFALCSEHHSWITRAQSHAGRKQRFELTVKQRWFFWFKLKNGELKRPRETRLDIEWRERSQRRGRRGDRRNVSSDISHAIVRWAIRKRSVCPLCPLCPSPVSCVSCVPVSVPCVPSPVSPRGALFSSMPTKVRDASIFNSYCLM